MENLTPKEKQRIYEEEHNALLKRLNLGLMYVVDFLQRPKLPILSLIALKIIARQGGRATVRYTDLSK